MTWSATLRVVGRVGRRTRPTDPPSLEHLKSQKNINIYITFGRSVIGETPKPREVVGQSVRHVRQKPPRTVLSTP